MCSRWDTWRWRFEWWHPRLVQFVYGDFGDTLSRSGLNFKWPQTGWIDFLNLNMRCHLMIWVDKDNGAIFFHLVMDPVGNTFALRLGEFNSCWITQMGIICRHFYTRKSIFEQCKLKKEVYLVCVSNRCVALRGWLIKALATIVCEQHTVDDVPKITKNERNDETR